MTMTHCNSAVRNVARRRAGFTLLEVLLALALGVLVLVAIGIAIDVHLRAVNAGRSQVEQGQLARAVLGHIAEDLRGSLRHQPFDASALTNVQSEIGGLDASMLDSALSAGSTGGSSGSSKTGSSTEVTDLSKTSSGAKGSTGGKGSSGGKESSGGKASTDSSKKSTSSSNKSSGSSASKSTSSTIDSTGSTGDSSDSSDQTEPVQVPGIYGNETELHIDLSRLPRVDERLSGPQLGDVKTVSYYVSSLSADGTGLRRSAIDRAGTLWSATQGGQPAAQGGEIIAPEVIAIEFQYFDGTEWHTTWDSTEKSGLPLAVEVAIAIASGSGRSAPTGSLFSSDPGSESSGIYRLLVQLPAAELPSTSTTSSSSTSSSEEAP